MKPVVAIVGRPNVGKSTLFNRLVGRKLAIVHDEPGVTRDRHYADAVVDDKPYLLVDTGGFDPTSDDPMRRGIKRQIDVALEEADVILCVLDATEPATSIDHAELDLLRRTKKPTIYVANKADSERVEHESTDLYRLGIDRVLAVSALHNRRIAELEIELSKALPAPAEEPAPEPSTEGLLRVAVVGKPNAGKSSLVNRLLGEERMLVDDRPGTTRDSIDAVVARGDRRWVFVDTAGIRRKAKVRKEASVVEGVSVIHAVKAMEKADVIVLLCDAHEGVAEQDAKILGLAVDRGRAIVLGLNKSDLLDKRELAKIEQDARDKLSFAPWAPICFLSARSGRGVDKLLDTIDRVGESFRKRVTTGALNRFFEQVLETHPPPTSQGKAPRLYYITQAETCPPTFVIQCNHPEKIHFSYRRYVQNQIRKTFAFEGVPVVVYYKPRRRRQDGDG
jgi:GTP-binding protein